MTPAQERCRNAQAQLWRSGTEPALFLCLLYQSNSDGGEKRRKEEGAGREQIGRRERHEQERGRKEKAKAERETQLKR